MSTVVYCDICGRAASAGHETIVHEGAEPAYLRLGMTESEIPPPGLLHVCRARDGMDVGCMGFYNEGLRHAKELARVRLGKRRPEALPQ